ncbi:dienelactone hydrolase family protein [Geodermatophilus sabuli]|uniref:Dienelactone hydrolase n=1 Tax=Geodermatophilus sabuli TaxID=1564158 RepID=A0A285E9C7_9ACTN|nr:dienelactone hydrolase family protein [Geodermatophilus sabuli]MBB3084864.1 dienelactone hydrolase [Geodermatophilus sabuli]SNX95728.1 Dienelactone hydrolase [Geodermatophilus sabuli]
MATIALFHSALGVRPGITDAADRLRAAGHDVLVVDQYGGRAFDDYAEASAYVEEVGFPALMQAALDGVGELPDGFVAAGFSNGAGMAEYVATQRRCAGALLFSGALPLAVMGVPGWPAGVPVQIHHGERDPFRHQEWLDAFVAEVRSGGGEVELVEYPVAGHLFTDPSLPAEFDATAAEALWERALAFCDRVTS